MNENQEIIIGAGLAEESESMSEQELLKALDELKFSICSTVDTNKQRFNALAKRALDLFVFRQNGAILSKLETVATAIGVRQFRTVIDYILGKGVVRFLKKDGSYSLPPQRIDRAKASLSQYRKEKLSFLDTEAVAVKFFKNENRAVEKDFQYSLELLKKYAKKQFKSNEKFLEKLNLFIATYQDNEEESDIVIDK